MSWSEQVFRYCERAADPSFWAEPLNAASNAAFLVVAGVGMARLARIRASAGVASSTRCGSDGFLVLLLVLVLAIGIGSFLFHTIATRWARFADVAPIGIFMVVYLVFALRAFLGWSWGPVLATLGGFLLANALLAILACPRPVVDIVSYARDPCLNSSMTYLPAVATLLVVAMLVRRRHPAGQQLLLAGGFFLLATLVRSLDKSSCSTTVLLGQPRGTHALWHLLVAVTLHVLMVAAVSVGRGTDRRA